MTTPTNNPGEQPSPWSQPGPASGGPTGAPDPTTGAAPPPSHNPPPAGPPIPTPPPGASPYAHPGFAPAPPPAPAGYPPPPYQPTPHQPYGAQPVYPPNPYQQQYGGTPRFISPNQLSPGRWWYGVAVGVFLLSICGGIGGFIAGAASSANDFNDNNDGTAFRPGVERTIELDADKDLGIFIEQASVADPSDIDCTGVSADGDQIDFKAENNGLDFKDGDNTITHVYSLNGIDASGEYTIECEDVGLEKDAVLWVAEEFDYTGIGIGAIVLLGAPCLGFLTAGTIALVVGLRRKSHKERLLRGGV